MIHLANILIVTDDPGLGDDLFHKLQKHRYLGQVVASQDEAIAEALQERPDIILVTERIRGGDPMTLTRTLKASGETADIPVCLLAGSISAELQKRAFAAEMADVLTPPLSDGKLIAKLRPLVRMSSMQAELQQRGEAAAHFGVSVEVKPQRRQQDKVDRILLIGLHADTLASHFPDAELTRAGNPYEAEDALDGSQFDAAIARLSGDPGPYLDLCAQLRNNPRLFNLPMILVSEPDKVDEETAYLHGVSAYFTDPADPFELNNAAQFLVRRQRQRWTIREALGHAAQPATRDPATGTFSRAFFDVYVKRRVEFALSHGRPLSIAFFRVPDVENIRQRFGDEQANHLRLQVAQWITGLLRVEDVTARFEENEFCVILPDSPESEAGIVINRIAGVLAYTDFAVRDVYEPVKVWVRVGNAELTPEDSVASLIARAREAMPMAQTGS